VAAIKTLMPHCCIGVDVIVGFPGETEEDFRETYAFLNELPISYLHVFPYSERANTPAASMKGAVPAQERSRRADMLRVLSEKKRRLFYEQHLGTKSEVLFEADVENGQMQGFTQNYIRVTAKYDPVLVNEVKQVRLTSITPEGLVEVEEAYAEQY
jgi:threonylcarbamoyladenosine tRNA methylthiotransferase MtaB